MFIVNVYSVHWSLTNGCDEAHVSESVGPFDSEEAAIDYAVDRYGVYPFDDVTGAFFGKLTLLPIFSIHKVVKP